MAFLNTCAFIANHPLNRTAKTAAFMRFLRWQLATRLMPAAIAAPFVNDSKLLMERGMTGATANYYCGLLEPAEMAFVLHSLRAGDLFADIGANIGSYTVLAGAVVGADVIAFEPLPATHAKLLRNITFNMITDRVNALCCGLSSEDGEIAFVSSLDTMNRVALPNETLPTVTVPVKRLDDICHTRIPRIVKIDVEGHELSVLNGGNTIFSSPTVAAVLMETNQSGAKFGVDDAQLFAKMAGFGFTPCEYDPFTRTLSAANPGASNTIFVRNPDETQTICRAAPRFQLVNGSI
jgi:FkbM family methyltransferase